MCKSLSDDSLRMNKRQPCSHMGEKQHQLLDCGIQETDMCRQDHLQKQIHCSSWRQLQTIVKDFKLSITLLKNYQ